MTFDVRDQEAFERLQARLVPLWHTIESFNHDRQTIVVIPSADVDLPLTAAEMQAYEERYLFLLFLLRQPRARMVYCTGNVIRPEIVDYYLDLMPGMLAGHARKRLHLVTPGEASPRPLARKLLERPDLMAEIRRLIPDHSRAHLVPFATTWDDREVAMRLDIPMYGTDPALISLGTKSEGRRLFAEEGLAHPAGRQHLHSEVELIEALVEMRTDDPGLEHVVVKLNDGVSGGGNAILDLTGLPAAGSAGERAAVAERLETLDMVLAGLDYEGFISKLVEKGGMVEELITGAEVLSPSVQMRITPLGRVELLSTHDQLLGGPSGQEFLGSVFPAHHEYAGLISSEAMKIGRRLAAEGVIGRFAIDFVVTRSEDEPWRSYAIELNLRKGGTTHPFLTLQFLTDGSFDPEAGRFTAPSGLHKFFVASDHVEDPALRSLEPEDLFDIVVDNDLHFDHATQTGAVFHMMSALPEKGRVGVTAVGNSREEAERRYHEVVDVLQRDASARIPPA